MEVGQHTQKQNYFLKQLNSIEKGQSVVLTQPIDMSHTLYQSKRFFCPQIVKRDSTAVRQTHYQQKFQKQTPRQAKQEWINRATAVRFDT